MALQTLVQSAYLSVLLLLTCFTEIFQHTTGNTCKAQANYCHFVVQGSLQWYPLSWKTFQVAVRMVRHHCLFRWGSSVKLCMCGVNGMDVISPLEGLTPPVVTHHIHDWASQSSQLVVKNAWVSINSWPTDWYGQLVKQTGWPFLPHTVLHTALYSFDHPPTVYLKACWVPVGNAVATHPPSQSLSTVSPQYGRLQHFHCRTAALPHDHAVDNVVTPCDIKEHQSNPQPGRKEASVGGGALCKVFLDGDNAGACVSFKGIGWLTSLSNHSSHMTLLGPSRL